MHNEIVNILNENRNKDIAVGMAAYMKNHFAFLGIAKPIRAQIQKDWLKQQCAKKEIDWNLVHSLWNLREREFQYVAMEYVIKMKKYLKIEDIKEVESLIITKSWWDSVDALATHLVGKLCELYPSLIQTHIKQWSTSENMWLRRTAILFQLKYKEKTDTALLKEIILQNNETKEFFINKAIGWALREYSKTNSEWVRAFIQHHDLSPLSVREGSKRL